MTPDPWMDHMRRGDFAAAWRISDARRAARAGEACWQRPRHEQWIWNGSSLRNKRVLIRCYHGLGDTIQFIRYAPRVKAVAREVIVWAQPALMSVLRHVVGIDRLLPLHDGAPEYAWDVDVEVMELPHVFRSTLRTLPAAVPYLAVKPPRAPLQPEGDVHVGLVWRAGEWDSRRSLSFETLRPLLALPGVTFHRLQHGAAGREGAFLAGVPFDAQDAGATAAYMRDLDLVITVDSFPAHLSGALGIPTWVLLHSDPDWRWMKGRADSPWYPTMRLFRQREAGEWQPVVAEVARALAEKRLAVNTALRESGSFSEHAHATNAAMAIGRLGNESLRFFRRPESVVGNDGP